LYELWAANNSFSPAAAFILTPSPMHPVCTHSIYLAMQQDTAASETACKVFQVRLRLLPLALSFLL
jgi:hypothetical protein